MRDLMLLKVAALALGAVCLASCGKAPRTPDRAIALSDQFSADFALIDQTGRLMRDDDLKGRVAIVYFGFATCPDVCPLALGRLSAALNELTPAEQEKVAPVFITVDPDRDTPDKIAAYVAFDNRLIGLTGDRAAIDKAKAGFKVYAQAEPVDDPKIGYTMNHSSLFYLVDKDGGLRYALQDALTPDEIAAAIRSRL